MAVKSQEKASQGICFLHVILFQTNASPINRPERKDSRKRIRSQESVGYQPIF